MVDLLLNCLYHLKHIYINNGGGFRIKKLTYLDVRQKSSCELRKLTQKLFRNISLMCIAFVRGFFPHPPEWAYAVSLFRSETFVLDLS